MQIHFKIWTLGLLAALCQVTVSASACFSNDKMGYVDIHGKEIISPEFLYASPFDHGYARCVSPTHKDTFFVDKKGHKFEVADANKRDPGLFTRFFSNGTVIEQNNFDEIVSRRGDFMLVRTPYEFFVTDRRKPKESLRRISPTVLGTNPKTGNLWIGQQDKTYEFTGVDNNGDIPGFEVVPNPEIHSDQYEFIGEFADGVAPALTKNGFWSYINADLNTVISLPLNCCHASQFHEGLAAVSFGGHSSPQIDGRPPFGPFPGAKFGFIDKSGRVVIDVKFPCPPRSNESREGIFKDGYALATAEVNESTAYGYIDKTGNFVIPPIYSYLGELKEGVAPFKSDVIGFKKPNGGQKYGSLLQFFKQFKYIGMDRQEVYDCLGKPSGSIAFPPADCFVVSQDCLGTTSIAVQFDEKNCAKAYAMGSFGFWSKSPFTNGEQSYTWITNNAKPEQDEDLQTFFARVATKLITPPHVDPLDTYELRQIDRCFVFPTPTQKKFDSETWKTAPGQRLSMLFDLYHRGLSGKTIDQIEVLLGKADRRDGTAADDLHWLFYDLKLPKYGIVEARFQFSKNKLCGLGVIAFSDSGFSNERNSVWHLQNLEKQNVVAEFDRYYSLVGMPLDLVPYAVGRPTTVDDSDAHLYKIYDLMELKTTLDNKYISQFRLRTGSDAKKDKLSDWQSKTNRSIDCIYPAGCWYQPEDPESYFIWPFYKPFSTANWSVNRNERKYMLFDLVHAHQLIGMRRGEVKKQLNKPDFIQSEVVDLSPIMYMKPNNSDPLTKDAEWYTIENDGNQTTYLQLSYKDNSVVAFRLTEKPNLETDSFPRTFEIGTHSL